MVTAVHLPGGFANTTKAPSITLTKGAVVNGMDLYVRSMCFHRFNINLKESICDSGNYSIFDIQICSD